MTLFIRMANSILESWKKDYDILSSVPLSFGISGGELYLNDFKVDIGREEISLICGKYTADTIELYVDFHRKIQINIAWPEDETPYVRSVWFGEGRL